MPEGPTRESTQKASNHEVVISGAVSGLVSRFVIAPLDVIKIRLQLQPHSVRHVSPGVVIKGPTYHGFLPTMKTIIAQEGVRALWKGNIPAELLYLTYGAVQFYTYRQTHLLLSSYTANTTSQVPLSSSLSSSIAGATAGAVATTITYPFDLLRTRFAATGPDRKVYTSLHHAITSIYKHEGAKGFFRGVSAGVVQIVPHMALFFGAYETIRTSLAHLHGASSSTGWEDATAGVVAGVIAKTGVFPLDTVRKRLQVQGPTRETYVHRNIPEYKGVVRTLGKIVKVEGWRGLYKGLVVSLVKAGPTSAVTMWTYGRTMLLVRWWEGKDDEVKVLN